MLTDKENTFCKALSLVGANAAVLTTSVYLGTKEVIPGMVSMKPEADYAEADFELVAQMVEGLDSAGGAATIQVELVAADDEDLTVNLRVLRASAAIAEAAAIAGYEFLINGKLPPNITESFIGLRLTTAGEAVTVGKISAFLARMRQSAGRK